MSYREVSVTEIREVLRLWVRGKSLRAIAELASPDRKSVRRYVEAAQAAGLVRDGGEEQLTDELLSAVVKAVRPGRPRGRGQAWVQSELMAQMPALVRLITLPFGRSADKAARALADLAVADRHAATGGEFYKRDKPTRPPRASLDTGSQQRLWDECARLLGVDPTADLGRAR